MTHSAMLPVSVAQKIEESGIPRDSVIFFQNSHWMFRGASILNENFRSLAQPFDTLGPFDVCPVDITFQLFPTESKYTVVSINHRLQNADNPATGYFAPIAEITLEGFARSTAKIPEEATHFCWLYPPNNISGDLNDDADSSNEGNLLRIGGFAYFKSNPAGSVPLELVRVNALIVSADNGLTFEGPFSWRSEFTEQLWAKNRFQPVTLKALREHGALYFAFTNPYEEFSSAPDQPGWTPSPHGAFVYLFSEDHSPHPFDCYFSVGDNCLGVAPSDEQM